jgi:hypothetical protein
MPDPLELASEIGDALKFTHRPHGGIALEARGALSPTVALIEIDAEQVEALRAWLGKHDAARRAEAAKEAVSAPPIREPLKRKGA